MFPGTVAIFLILFMLDKENVVWQKKGMECEMLLLWYTDKKGNNITSYEACLYQEYRVKKNECFGIEW